MSVLQIDYEVVDLDSWKRSFDNGWLLCAARHRGLRGHQVLRESTSPTRVRVELEFRRAEDAEAVLGALVELRQARLAGSDAVTRVSLRAP